MDEPAPDELHARARALADPTRARIVGLLAAADGWTVTELVDELGLHHSVVRDHLATLEAADLVSAARRESGSRGRPPLVYRATAGAESLLLDPPRLAELSRLLARIAATGRPPGEVGRDHARTLTPPAGPPGRTPLDRFLDDLRARGFRPSADDLGAGGGDAGQHDLTIRLQRCPFVDAAEDAPAVVCALHRGLAEGVAEQVGDITVRGLVARPPRTAGCELRVRVDDPDE